MPEPNLPSINLNTLDMNALRNSLPEMPDLTREALGSYNVRPQEIEIMVVSIWNCTTWFESKAERVFFRFKILRNTQTY